MICCAVLIIKAEVACTHELECRRVGTGAVLSAVKFLCDFLHGLLNLAALKNCQAFGIQRFEEILVRSVRIGIGELPRPCSFPNQPSESWRL